MIVLPEFPALDSVEGLALTTCFVTSCTKLIPEEFAGGSSSRACRIPMLFLMP